LASRSDPGSEDPAPEPREGCGKELVVARPCPAIWRDLGHHSVNDRQTFLSHQFSKYGLIGPALT